MLSLLEVIVGLLLAFWFLSLCVHVCICCWLVSVVGDYVYASCRVWSFTNKVWWQRPYVCPAAAWRCLLVMVKQPPARQAEQRRPRQGPPGRQTAQFHPSQQARAPQTAQHRHQQQMVAPAADDGSCVTEVGQARCPSIQCLVVGHYVMLPYHEKTANNSECMV